MWNPTPFALAGESGSSAISLYGMFHGDGASAVTGVFTSLLTSGKRYAGGFVGGGPRTVSVIRRFEDGAGLAGTVRRIGDASHDSRLVFAAGSLDAVVDEANSPADAIRAQSLVASINPAAFNSSTPATGAITGRTGGSFAYSGGSIGVASYEARGGAARLLVLDGSNQCRCRFAHCRRRFGC